MIGGKNPQKSRIQQNLLTVSKLLPLWQDGALEIRGVSFTTAFHTVHSIQLPWWPRRKSICLQCGRPGFVPWVGIPWRRKWRSIPVLLPGKSHGQRSLVDYSPWGPKESNTTEQLHFHFPFPYSAYLAQCLAHIQPGSENTCRIYSRR